MLDVRYLAVALVIGTFMLVTVGHVANYAGSFEAGGWWWLGWPYALAVDFAIVICVWLTRWKRPRPLAWAGYILFALASGAMNAAAVRPGWDFFAWVYALFPTGAIVLLGMLAREVEREAEAGKPRGVLAILSRRIARRAAGAKQGYEQTDQNEKQTNQNPNQMEQDINLVKPFVCGSCGADFASQRALNGHGNAHRDNHRHIEQFDKQKTL